MTPRPNSSAMAGHRLDLGQWSATAWMTLTRIMKCPVAGVVRVQPVPLEQSDVIGTQGLPPLARGAEQFGEDVEAVSLGLNAFDLAHGVPRKVPTRGANHKEPGSGFG